VVLLNFIRNLLFLGCSYTFAASRHAARHDAAACRAARAAFSWLYFTFYTEKSPRGMTRGGVSCHGYTYAAAAAKNATPRRTRVAARGAARHGLNMENLKLLTRDGYTSLNFAARHAARQNERSITITCCGTRRPWEIAAARQTRRAASPSITMTRGVPRGMTRGGKLCRGAACRAAPRRKYKCSLTLNWY